MFDSKYVLSIILDGNWRVSGDDESEELGFSSVEDMFIYCLLYTSPSPRD